MSPADRADLASAVNNTARQAAGAIAHRRFRCARRPAHRHFIAGIHMAALIAAGLFVVAAIAAFTLSLSEVTAELT